MGACSDTASLLAAVTRLAGAPVRKARHAWMFRIEVISSDGLKCGVPVMVSNHRPKGRVLDSVISNIADCWVIDRGKIETVLDDWSADDLRAHLGSCTRDQLKPKHLR